MRKVAALIATIPIILAGCNQAARPAAAALSSAQEIADLKQKLKDIEKEVMTLKISEFKTSFKLDEFAKKNVTRTFNPADPAFRRIESAYATFIVSVQDVRQFGDGVSVKLNLGNTSTATIAGVTLHIQYGPREPEYTSELDSPHDKWEAVLKKKDVGITEQLHPGSWNPVSVVLPSIDQKDFGYMSMSIDSQTLALRS